MVYALGIYINIFRFKADFCGNVRDEQPGGKTGLGKLRRTLRGCQRLDAWTYWQQYGMYPESDMAGLNFRTDIHVLV